MNNRTAIFLIIFVCAMFCLMVLFRDFFEQNNDYNPWVGRRVVIQQDTLTIVGVKSGDGLNYILSNGVIIKDILLPLVVVKEKR